MARSRRRRARIRLELLQAITEKEKGIETAWRNVATGYAELRAPLKLPRTRALPKRSPTLEEGVFLIEMYLQQIHQMLTSHQFERELPKRLQEVVADHLPELASTAEDLRELIHDLNDNEPGATEEMLESRLHGLERALDDAFRARRRIPPMVSAEDSTGPRSRGRARVGPSRRVRVRDTDPSLAARKSLA